MRKRCGFSFFKQNQSSHDHELGLRKEGTKRKTKAVCRAVVRIEQAQLHQVTSPTLILCFPVGWAGYGLIHHFFGPIWS